MPLRSQPCCVHLFAVALLCAHCFPSFPFSVGGTVPAPRGFLGLLVVMRMFGGEELGEGAELGGVVMFEVVWWVVRSVGAGRHAFSGKGTQFEFGTAQKGSMGTEPNSCFGGSYLLTIQNSGSVSWKFFTQPIALRGLYGVMGENGFRDIMGIDARGTKPVPGVRFIRSRTSCGSTTPQKGRCHSMTH